MKRRKPVSISENMDRDKSCFYIYCESKKMDKVEKFKRFLCLILNKLIYNYRNCNL